MNFSRTTRIVYSVPTEFLYIPENPRLHSIGVVQDILLTNQIKHYDSPPVTVDGILDQILRKIPVKGIHLLSLFN
jgi:hypothetical protein